MRLALTVVSPVARQTADILLDADPATPVADVAAQLERFMHAATLSADGARVVRFPGPGVEHRDRWRVAGATSDRKPWRCSSITARCRWTRR